MPTEEDSAHANDDSDPEAGRSRILYDNSAESDLAEAEDGDNMSEPEEVRRAWEELVIIQREQQRYSDIKLDLVQDLEEFKARQKYLEDVSC